MIACLYVIVWQRVQGVPCLSRYESWDKLQLQQPWIRLAVWMKNGWKFQTGFDYWLFSWALKPENIFQHSSVRNMTFVYSSSGFCCLSGWFGCRGCWWSSVHTALGLGWWSFNYGCERCSYIMALMYMEEGWVTFFCWIWLVCVFSTLVLSLH